MSPERFEHLLSMITPFIKKGVCRSRAPVSSSERLCICLRNLATGDSHQSQSFSFKVGRATISNTVQEICDAIWKILREQFLIEPEKLHDWFS